MRPRWTDLVADAAMRSIVCFFWLLVGVLGLSLYAATVHGQITGEQVAFVLGKLAAYVVTADLAVGILRAGWRACCAARKARRDAETQ